MVINKISKKFIHIYKTILKKCFIFNFKFKINPKAAQPYTIRKYVKNDETEIINIINRVIDPDLNLNKWNWKYGKNIKNEIIVAINEKKEIVGHMAKIYNDGICNKKNKGLCQVTDICLLPEYRGQNFLKSSLSKITINFLAYGFTDNKTLSFAYANTSNSINGNVGKTVSFKVPIYQKKINSVKHKDNVYIVKKADIKYANEIDMLWNKKLSEIDTGICRDWKYLKWRILDSPENQDLFLINKYKDTIGYFSTKYKNGNIIITDLLILNEHYINAFEAIEKFCKKLNAKKILIAISDRKLSKHLKKLNYKIFKKAYFVYFDINGDTIPSNYYLTLNDADWDLGI